jgi:hypothetical protein
VAFLKPGRRRTRPGVALPFILLMIVTFVGVSAFVIDVARMLVIRAELQTSADAGAMGGVLEFMTALSDKAQDSALVYARRNLADNETVDIDEDEDVLPGTWTSGTFTPTGSWTSSANNAVSVTTRHTGTYILGRFFSVFSSGLGASAVGAVGSVSATDCVRPLAVPYRKLLDVLYPPANSKSINYDLTPTDISNLKNATSANQISLKIGDPTATIVNANFYAVREGPILYADGTVGNPWQGGDDYRDALAASCNDLTHVIGVGDWLQAEQGNKEGPTKQGLADKCGVAGNPASFNCNPEVSYIIPIWDTNNKNIATPNAFHVKYVGVFKVTRYDKNLGIMGYFSAMAGDGKFSSAAGPVQQIALVR